MAYDGDFLLESKIGLTQNSFTERRVGKFRLSGKYLYGDLSKVQALFKDLLVLRAENDFASNAIEYTVTGEMLDPIEEGTIPPFYEVIIKPSGIELVSGRNKKAIREEEIISMQVVKGDGKQIEVDCDNFADEFVDNTFAIVWMIEAIRNVQCSRNAGAFILAEGNLSDMSFLQYDINMDKGGLYEEIQTKCYMARESRQSNAEVVEKICCNKPDLSGVHWGWSC